MRGGEREQMEMHGRNRRRSIPPHPSPNPVGRLHRIDSRAGGKSAGKRRQEATAGRAHRRGGGSALPRRRRRQGKPSQREGRVAVQDPAARSDDRSSEREVASVGSSSNPATPVKTTTKKRKSMADELAPFFAAAGLNDDAPTIEGGVIAGRGRAAVPPGAPLGNPAFGYWAAAPPAPTPRPVGQQQPVFFGGSPFMPQGMLLQQQFPPGGPAYPSVAPAMADPHQHARVEHMPQHPSLPIPVEDSEEEEEEHDVEEEPELRRRRKGKARHVDTGSGRGKGRGRSFTVPEQSALVHAYLRHTQDPTIGTDQSGATMWKKTVQTYHESEHVNETRTLKSLKCQWSKINGAVAKFAGFYRSVKDRPRSGWTEEDKMTHARTMYKEHEKKEFEFEHCYHWLKNQPKWLWEAGLLQSCGAKSSGSAGSKRKSACESGGSASVSQGVDYRPPGVKRSKAARALNGEMGNFFQQFFDMKNSMRGSSRPADLVKQEQHEEHILSINLDEVDNPKSKLWYKIKQKKIMKRLMEEEAEFGSEEDEPSEGEGHGSGSV